MIDSSLVSNISVHSSDTVELKSISIDDITFGIFTTSIDLLKGEHKFEIVYEYSKTDTCYTGYGYCSVRVSVGRCLGKIRTLEGRNYLINLSGKSGILKLNVLAKGYYDFTTREDEVDIGHGSCTEESSYYTTKSDRL